MNYLVYLVYPVLLIILLWGAKLYGRSQWNEECFSVRQMKAVQGFFALCIILHHIGQKTCAGWLPPRQIIPGLELFVPIGYLFVAVFLFCSGYGLYKSYQTKGNYLVGFVKKRILPVFLTAYIINLVYFVLRIVMGEKMSLCTAVEYLTGTRLCNVDGWFIYAILIFYLGFYLAFRYCKKERNALIIMVLWVLLYCLIGTCINHNNRIFCGEWWYNSVASILFGIFFAKYEKPVTNKIRKHYVLYLIATVLLYSAFYYLGEFFQSFFSYYGENYGLDFVVLRRWACLTIQILICLEFIALVFLLGMKLRIDNRVLTFLGTMTFEIYLVHTVFVELFSRSFLGFLRPIFFCSNVSLYILIVTIPTIPLAIFLKKIVRKFSQEIVGVR